MTIQYFALALLLLPSHGQEAPNRFKKTPDLPKSPNELPIVVTNSIEHFLVAKEDLHQWQASHPDEKITRELVANWVKQGQTSLDKAFFFSNRLEQFFALNTGKSLTYPVEYAPSNFPGEWNIPSTFDLKYLGHFFDTIVSQDGQGRLQASLSVGAAQIIGSDSHSAYIEEKRSPDDLFMPNFKTYRQNCSVTYTKGAHHLVGIFNSLEDETKACLIFSEAGSTTLDPIPKNRPAVTLSKPLTVTADFIEIPSLIWIDYCQNQTPDQLRINTATWSAALLKEQKAIRIKTLSKEVTWGEKNDLNPNGKLSSNISSFKPTDPSKRLSPSNPLIPIEVTDGLKNFVMQITPEVTPSGHVLLTYIWQMHTPWKDYVIHRVFDGEKWIPDAWAPCKSLMIQESALFFNPGEKTLVGALPVESDQADGSPAKMRLFFLKAE